MVPDQDMEAGSFLWSFVTGYSLMKEIPFFSMFILGVPWAALDHLRYRTAMVFEKGMGLKLPN